MRSYQHAASIAGNKKQSMANHNVVDRRESWTLPVADRQYPTDELPNYKARLA
jgi:hypothetical protein